MNAQVRDHEIETLRVPPHSIEAEQSVLGGLLLAKDALIRISDWLAVDDFYRRDHRLIYQAILAMPTAHDVVTICDWLDAQGLGEQVGRGYVIELATTTPSAANIVAYAEIVAEKSRQRQNIAVGSQLVQDGFAGRDSAEAASIATHALIQLRGDPKGGGLVSVSAGLLDWVEDLRARYDAGNHITGLPYPWMEVNRVTHGLQPGELTIIAGRPSMGKSIMGLNMAIFSALRGTNTAFFSLEMTMLQVNRRAISALGEIPHDWLLAPNEDGGDYWPNVTAATTRLKSACLHVDESASLRTEQVVARARRAHLQNPIGLIVIDHLHDLDFPGKRDMRHEVGAAAAAAKMLAKEFKCPAVVLAQLNRGVEERPNKRPIMKDLRESGELEQKADVIWFLYRDDYYAQKENADHVDTRDVELILGKGRDLKSTRPIVLRENFDFMSLLDWDYRTHGSVPKRNSTAIARRGVS